MNGYSLDEAIELYKSVGTRNAEFLFRWLHDIYDKTYLPSIDPLYKEVLTLDKTKLTIFDVLVDDLADNAKIRSKRLLEEAVRIPWNNNKHFVNHYLSVTQKIWLDCIKSIKQYPRYDEFKDIFYFDLDQVMHSMRYSFLVNSTDISNSLEDNIYSNHGVMVILHCDMDLMCSPGFDYEELKKLRPILYWAQDIAHIGNMLNTYPREIIEGDFSSPIIALGLIEGIIQKKMIIEDPEYALENLQPLVSHFKTRMENNLQKIKEHADDLKSVNIKEFYGRLKNVWESFLQRPHYWENAEDKESKKNIAYTLKPIPTSIMQWVRM